MSLGKKLLGMFVETEDQEPTQPQPGASAPPKSPTPENRPAAPVTISVSPPPKQSGPRPVDGADEALVAKLRQTLQESNRPGFDFLEFQASLLALEKVVPDEATRYRSAFATAATMGVTVPVLLEAARWYRELLKSESKEFEQELQAKRKTEIGTKQSEIERLQKDIASASETIQRLTREIGENQAKAKALQSQMDESTTRLDRAKARFEKSVQTVDAEIQLQQQQIQTILGQGA